MLLLVTIPSWCADGDTFISNTIEGVEMTFMVISESEKTCQVGNDGYPVISSHYSGEITIPSTANGYCVVSIESQAFSYCYGLTAITIPSNVKSIGAMAFYDCLNLISITLPSSVTSIGDRAFCDCSSLTSIIIPSSVTNIGDRAFSGCSSLNAVTCLATNKSATDCTNYWLSGVAATGTFTKASTMTSWTTGVSSVPSGWTVVDAQ